MHEVLNIDKKGKSILHPLNYGGGLLNPLNYETVYFTPWIFQNRSNYPPDRFEMATVTVWLLQ
jgi:hypothetical protein